MAMGVIGNSSHFESAGCIMLPSWTDVNSTTTIFVATNSAVKTAIELNVLHKRIRIKKEKYYWGLHGLICRTVLITVVDKNCFFVRRFLLTKNCLINFLLISLRWNCLRCFRRILTNFAFFRHCRNRQENGWGVCKNRRENGWVGKYFEGINCRWWKFSSICKSETDKNFLYYLLSTLLKGHENCLELIIVHFILYYLNHFKLFL